MLLISIHLYSIFIKQQYLAYTYKRGILMKDIQNYNMEHVYTLAPDTIKESIMRRHSQLSLLLADIQGRISNAPEGSLRTGKPQNIHL